MIKKRTVFILGAGASMPYGLPSGVDLGAYIHERQNVVIEHATRVGFTQENVETFAGEFLRSRLTIDAFLGRRPAHAPLGKLAIASLLCGMEVPQHVFQVRHGDDDDWYGALWRAMVGDNSGELGENQVRFITFNYDRSLEYFLHEATKGAFGTTDAEAFPIWEQLPILHVHGKLGDFCAAPTDGRRMYHPSITPESLRIAADSILVIPETRDDSETFVEARKWCEWAERICFLGFGFDTLNIQRLGLNTVVEARKKTPGVKPIEFYASTYGKYKVEIEAVEAAVTPNAAFHKSEHKNLKALRELGLLG